MIVGFKCPAKECDGARVSLDHFATTPCGATIHPDYAAAVLAEGGAREGVHVTDVTGCPRQRGITAQADIWVNPVDYNALLIGKAWHEFLHMRAYDLPLTEVPVWGTLDGVEVVGTMDSISVDGTTVGDWKHGSNWRQKHIAKEGVSMEHRIQTSLYAELYAQMGYPRPVKGCNWYHFSGAAADCLMPLEYELLSVEECLVHKPYGGEASVREILHLMNWLVGGNGSWNELPLTGKTQLFGTKTACDYCQVRDTCWEEAYGAPF